MAEVEIQEAFRRIEQGQFELRQALVHLGGSVLYMKIEAGELDRSEIVKKLREAAERYGESCAKRGGTGQPNPVLAEIADHLEGLGPFRVIDGGRQDDDEGPGAA